MNPQTLGRQLADDLADAEFAFKDTLVAARKRANLTQADVAARMGIPARQVAELERLDSNPTLSRLRNYAYAIGARIQYTIIEGEQ